MNGDVISARTHNLLATGYHLIFLEKMCVLIDSWIMWGNFLGKNEITTVHITKFNYKYMVWNQVPKLSFTNFVNLKTFNVRVNGAKLYSRPLERNPTLSQMFMVTK